MVMRSSGAGERHDWQGIYCHMWERISLDGFATLRVFDLDGERLAVLDGER